MHLGASFDASRLLRSRLLPSPARMPPGTRAEPRAYQPDGPCRAQHEPGDLPLKPSLPNGGEL
eukprot:872923-Heterocapsa_arctica.AAC.1